jgi:hypothetical protein
VWIEQIRDPEDTEDLFLVSSQQAGVEARQTIALCDLRLFVNPQ